MYARELLFFMGVPLCGGLVADGEALPLVLGILEFVYEGHRIVRFLSAGISQGCR